MAGPPYEAQELMGANLLSNNVLVEGPKEDRIQGQNLGGTLRLLSSSVERLPQTPSFDLEFMIEREEVKDVVPNEKDLVETQITWHVGKTLGLQVSDDRAMIVVLAKVRELQDFVLSKKRGRPKKKKRPF